MQDYTWILDRIIETTLRVLYRNFTIVGVNVPVEGKEQEREEFYWELQQNMQKVCKTENTTLAADFNGRIGNQPIEENIGPYGEQITSNIGATLSDFCALNKFKMKKKKKNLFYRHKDIHKFTWDARGNKSIIDYIIIDDRLVSNIEEKRVFRRSEIDRDHNLVESKFKFLKKSSNKTDETVYKNIQHLKYICWNKNQ